MIKIKLGDYNDLTVQEVAYREGKGERFGLYLRIPALDGEQYDKARNLLEIFDGQTPVYFYLTGQKKLVLAPRTLWVMLNDPMVSELKRILGEKNVAIKE